MSDALESTLTIDPTVFLEAYNMPIKDFVERNTFRESNQKGKTILYMSYSHAIRIMRSKFPGMEVTCEVNPKTGSYVFEELEGRGYFLKPFCYEKVEGQPPKRSGSIYFAVLSTSGLAILPSDKDKNGKPIANIQTFNTAFYRACAKAIAWTTGIGLKLWTGDDLDSDIIDEKLERISKVYELAEEYRKLTGSTFQGLEDLDYTSSTELINSMGRSLAQDIKAINLKNEKAK